MELNPIALWGRCLVVLLLQASFASGWTYQSKGQRHPCDRKCVKGAKPQTCSYEWTLEQYITMSGNCKRCPYEIKDCSNIGCIPADGVQRMITVINKQMPGPQINVCKGDTINVTVINHAGVDATTIHWHGQNQVGTPYMDGVPMVTQCPVHPFTSFQYVYKAADVGSFFYHSHTGFQRTDGVNGFMSVRQPKEDDPNNAHYDVDSSDHQIMLTDWMNKTGEEMLTEFYQSSADYGEYLDSILVNGRARLQKYTNATTGTEHYTPYSSFVVKKGLRYRFRVCSNGNWICPIQVSVVNHDLTVLGTDMDSIQPRVVNAIVVNPGERFDFVINANQNIGTYWMLFKGLLRCETKNTVGRAILKYETASDVDPPEPGPINPKPVLNPVNDYFTSNDQVSLLELKSHTRDPELMKPKADTQIYIPFNLYPNLNSDYSTPNALLPMVNSIAFFAPPSPLLSQFNDVPKDRICTDATITKNCSAEFCQCAYYIKVNLKATVELVLVDEGPTPQQGVNHPWHLHGHHFRVVGGSMLKENNTVKHIKAMDEAGEIKRNLDRPVIKDTVTIPHGGFTVVRFHATNPGFWAMHCHVEMHTEVGMMLVFQVGELNSFPPVPKGFPQCGNYHFAGKK